MTVPAPFVFDPGVRAHARTLERLETEQVAWLGTIGRDGYPHAVPIWFLWQDGRALIMSEPETAKVRNIRAHDRVLLHLEAPASSVLTGDMLDTDDEQLVDHASRFVARVPPSLRPEPGSQVRLRVDLDRVHLFDPKTEAVIAR